MGSCVIVATTPTARGIETSSTGATGSTDPSKVATTPTARGIETVMRLLINYTQINLVATTPTARGIETLQKHLTSVFQIATLQQHLPPAVLKLDATLCSSFKNIF